MRRTTDSTQRGSAMVISLLALALMTLVGMAMVAQSRTETQIAANDMWTTQALYHAEAGCAEVLVRMSDPSDTANYVGPAEGEWAVEPGWGRYVVTSDGASKQDPALAATAKDGLDNDADGFVDESEERYPEIKSKQTGEVLNYTWVKCQYKLDGANDVVLFGNHDGDLSTPPRYNTTEGFPVLVITAQGAEGPARRTVQVEAVKFPFEMVEAALYAESDNFQFDGTSFMVSGVDWDPLADEPVVGGEEQPGLLTTGDADAVQSELKAGQVFNVEGQGLEPSVVKTSTDVDLEALASEYRSQARMTFPGGSYDNVAWGDYDNYTVVHVQGDLYGQGQGVGGGVLVVDGDFHCSGQWIWYGVVLVMGNIDFSGGGKGIHIYGTLLTAGSGTNVIGGNSDICYSSAALNKLTAQAPYKTVNWREL